MVNRNDHECFHDELVNRNDRECYYDEMANKDDHECFHDDMVNKRPWMFLRWDGQQERPWMLLRWDGQQERPWMCVWVDVQQERPWMFLRWDGHHRWPLTRKILNVSTLRRLTGLAFNKKDPECFYVEMANRVDLQQGWPWMCVWVDREKGKPRADNEETFQHYNILFRIKGV